MAVAVLAAMVKSVTGLRPRQAGAPGQQRDGGVRGGSGDL